MASIKIPYDGLSSETLQRLVEEVVTRIGTDYGEEEIPTEKKVDQVMRALRTKKAIILYDTSTETCNILSTDDPRVKALKKAE